MICRDILKAIENVRILTPRSYTFNGSHPIEAGETDQFATIHNSSPLAVHIANTLYFNCYAVPFDADRFRGVDEFLPPADEYFQRELSSANQSREGWQGGWQVTHHSPVGTIRVSRGTQTRTARSGDFAFIPQGRTQKHSQRVKLRIQKESVGRQPVFYYLYGETFGDEFSAFDRVRFYFNCEAAGAPPLIRILSSRLNEFQIPFQMKCLNSPGAYNRTDAAVLYLLRHHFHIGAELVQEAAEKLATFFRPEIPLFSRLLAPGVGIADDPGARDSFGTSRCRTLAEGLIDAWCAGAVSIDQRVQFVTERFAACGYDLERPWLGRHMDDIFEDYPTTSFTPLQSVS